MRAYHTIFFIVCIGSLMISCSSKEEASTDTTSKVDKQIYFEGKQLYAGTCAQCHQVDGKGLNKLYPPLANSDYLMNDILGASKIIKHGLSGAIKVNDIEFNRPMKGFEYLTDQEVASILTYISNSWGNQYKTVAPQDVSKILNE